MFNLFVEPVLERLIGRKPVVLLGELSGTSERTWRNRLKHGWEASEREQEELGQRFTAALTKQLVEDGEWPPEEAHAILANRPARLIGVPLPTADLIYNFSPRYGAYCQETIQLATHFDRECDRLGQAVHAGDVESVRSVLLAMLDWLQSFCTDEPDTEDVEALHARLVLCDAVKDLLAVAKPLNEGLLLHLLSCWDVEFCAGYFGGTVQAYPLFELVMPRFAADICIDPETGRLSRLGRQPRKRVLETATSRLIDFISVLAAWQRYRQMPSDVPRLKDFAAWCNEEETRLVSWRDETTKFTYRQAESLWTSVISPNSEGTYPAVPSPIVVCATLWKPLLVREDGRPSELIDCTKGYRAWWERNRARLVAKKDLLFGEQAWPTWLTAQRPESESFAAICAFQSAGRLASPRDCQ